MSLSKNCVFTIVSKNYMHYARTLLNSVLSNLDDVDVIVGLCDSVDGFDFSADNFDIIEIKNLDNIEDLEKFIFRYTILELNTAIKPYIIEKLFNRRYEKVIYFDPDIKIYSSLSDMVGLLENYDILLTPHLTGILDDGKKPDELDILRSGTYNLGYIGLKQSENTRSFLKWWQSKLFEHCVVNLDKGLFVDQKWIDMVPGMFSKTLIIRNPAWNVAYWNLNHRKISKKGDNFFVDDSELIFFHFSGFSPDSKTLSMHQNRFDKKSAGKYVHALCEDYTTDLLKNGYSECSAYPYAFSTFPDGTFIPDTARYIYRDEFDWKNDVNNIWSNEGAANFIGFLNEPVRIDSRQIDYLTRLSMYLYEKREDLREAFPDLLSNNGLRYAYWFVENACEQAGFDECFIIPVKQALSVYEQQNHQEPASNFVAKNVFYSRIYKIAYRFRHFVRPFVGPQKRQEIKTKLLKKTMEDVTDTMTTGGVSEDSLKSFSDYSFGVNLYGYVHAESGVGQSARASIESLTSAGVPISVIDFRHGNISRMSAKVDESLKGEAIYGFNLFHVNADQTIPALDVLGYEVLKGHYNIGYWVWELPEFPDEWVDVSHYLDEIWTPTTFCKDAFDRKLNIPVRVVPHSIWLETDVVQKGNSGSTFEYGKFIYLTMFDCLSVPERKNVFAVIDAFEMAFPKNSGQAALVIKVSNIDVDNNFSKKLKVIIQNNSDIILIPKCLDRKDILSLLSESDCFVSLHRSEGFGLGIAEAMLLKKPVIVTGWSGNMEFCNSRNAMLVDYSLVKITEDHGPYKDGQTWADPSVEHASSLMKKVYDNSAFREDIACAGHEYVVRNFAPAKIGETIASYLSQIADIAISSQ